MKAYYSKVLQHQFSKNKFKDDEILFICELIVQNIFTKYFTLFESKLEMYKFIKPNVLKAHVMMNPRQWLDSHLSDNVKTAYEIMKKYTINDERAVLKEFIENGIDTVFM